MEVYVLWHIRPADDGDNEKLIGVYSTAPLARDAAKRLATQPGFADLPNLQTGEGDAEGGFRIVPYTLDEDGWTEGFVTVPVG